MATVTIYSTPTCGYCNVAKEFFKANNIAYTEKNVASDLVAREEMVTKTHQLGVPVIDVDGKIMIGYNKVKLAQMLGVAA